MVRKTSVFWAVVLAIASLGFWSQPAAAWYVNFDNLPEGSGPQVVLPAVVFDGGLVLNTDLAPTLPHMFTASSQWPPTLTATFTAPANWVSLHLQNLTPDPWLFQVQAYHGDSCRDRDTRWIEGQGEAKVLLMADAIDRLNIQVVPLPGALVLLATGLAGLAWRRRYDARGMNCNNQPRRQLP